MSLLEQIKKRCAKGRDESLRKSTKIYTLGEPYESSDKDIKNWKCDAVADQKIKTYTNPTIFESLDDLCDKLRKSIDQHQSRKRRHDEDINLRKPKTFYITESCLYKCLERCLNEKNFYSKSGLDFLIDNHFVTAMVHNVLVECIIKYGDVDLLKNPTSKIKLKESLILKLLKHIINNIDNKEVNNIEKSVSLEGFAINQTILKNLMVILSLEMGLSVMKEQLKLLLANEAILLLQLLRYVLFQVSPAFHGDADYIPPSKNQVNEKTVVQWIDSLISAQMISFVTSPIAKPIVEELNTNIGNQINFYSIIGSFVPFMEALTKEYDLPKSKLKDYAIEVVRL